MGKSRKSKFIILKKKLQLYEYLRYGGQQWPGGIIFQPINGPNLNKLAETKPYVRNHGSLLYSHDDEIGRIKKWLLTYKLLKI